MKSLEKEIQKIKEASYKKLATLLALRRAKKGFYSLAELQRKYFPKAFEAEET